MKRNRKLEIAMGDFHPKVKDGLNKKKKACSAFLLLGFGVIACAFCYATYFPGVVWINPSIPTNRVSQDNLTLLKEKPFQARYFSSQSIWKFWTTSSKNINDAKNFTERHSTMTRDGLKPSLSEGKRTCNFPRLNPFDPSIIEFIKGPPIINCLANHPLVFRTDFGNTLIQLKKLENSTCCYRSIVRGEASDHNIKYSKKCHKITNHEMKIPPSHEFISIKCTVAENQLLNRTNMLNPTNGTTHRDMAAFVSLKPQVESRIKAFEMNEMKLKEMDQSRINEDKLSVLILGLDAQSHMNFIRQMPLTYNFLVKNLSAIGLHGYTKVADNTFPNVIPILSGLTVGELKKECWPNKLSYFDGCPFIWRKFAARGFRTSFAEDSIWMGTFNYEKKGFRNPPTDYYFHPLSLLMAKKIGHETWGNAKLCYGPRLAFEILLDYIVKTAVTFRSKLYFQYVWANSLFHDYLNNPKLGDELLYLTLEYLHRNSYLNNTAFILLSDHGLRWGSIRNTNQGKIEERMPLAYFSFPSWFREKYSHAMENLLSNSARLTTPFDIHETLRNILDIRSMSTKSFSGGEIPRGISLFRPVPLSRTCNMAGIEEHWCVCHSMQAIPKNSSVVKNAAQFIVNSINKLLLKFNSCAKLQLYKINEAMRKIDGDFDRGLDIDLNSNNTSMYSNNTSRNAVLKFSNIYTNKTENNRKKDVNNGKRIQLQISLVTKPSNAVFEATVYGFIASGAWKLSGDISRLNLYREQSLCVSDYNAQKYCYCLNQSDSDEE